MIYTDFKYYFLDEEGKSYYVDGAGNIKLSGVPLALEVGPDGWQSTSIRWTRNAQGFGNVRSYTTQYKYVLSAAKILRHFMYTQGTEGKLYLLVLMLDKSFGGGWKYRKLLKSELDFATAEDDQYSVAINAMEGGLIKLLKANENTQYDIPLFDNDEVILKHDGVDIETSGRFNMVDGVQYAYSMYGAGLYPSVTFTAEEGRAPGIDFKTQSLAPRSAMQDLATNENWLIQNTNEFPVDVKLSGVIKWKCVFNSIGSAAFRMRFRLASRGLIGQEDFVFTPISELITGETHTHEFELIIPMAPLDKLYIEHVIGGVPTGAIDTIVEYLPDSFIKAFAVARKPATNVNAFTPKVLGQKILDRIAGPGYVFTSPVLETKYRGLLVTSEDALRGLEKPHIRTSWNDFFNSYNVPCGLTWVAEGRTLRVMPKAEAFGETEVLNLGDAVNDAVLKFSDAHSYNTVLIGYPEMKYQDANGRFEYNTTVQWTSAVARVVKELKLVSTYSASIYDQEFTRINFEAKETTNSETGTANFFIDCDPFPILHESGLYSYYRIKRGGYASIEGLVYPDSAFNLDITPIKCLYAHGDYLRAVFYFEQNTKLTFASTKGNRDLVTTTIAGVRQAEAEDVEIQDFAPALFIPMELDVQTAMPIETVDVMDALPNETFSVRAFGVELKGHPSNVEVQPADNGAQKTRLLLSKNNDLTKLIRV